MKIYNFNNYIGTLTITDSEKVPRSENVRKNYADF